MEESPSGAGSHKRTRPVEAAGAADAQTRPPRLGKHCAFSPSFHRALPHHKHTQRKTRKSTGHWASWSPFSQFRTHMNFRGSSHKCVHDLAPGRSATAVGRRCGCTRARYATAQSSVAQSTAACAGPALGGGPARRQPDQTQAADSMALTRRRTVKDRRTQPRLSPTFYARAEPSLTVQPRWNWQPRHDSAACCGRTFREPATPLQIQTVFFSHVSH